MRTVTGMAEYKSPYSGAIMQTDYVPRQAIFEAMYHYQRPLREREVRDIPAANVRENVKGEWDMDSVAFYRKCPNCKCCVRDNRYEVFLDGGGLHFCPNCGAQMMGGSGND